MSLPSVNRGVLRLKMSAPAAAALRCPRCGHPLAADDDTALVCGSVSCGRRYPVIRGVPILINEDASLFEIDSIAQATMLEHRPGFLARLREALPPLSRNFRAAENFRKLRHALGEAVQRRVLVVGGGTAAEGIAELKRSPNVEVIESDVFVGPEAAIVCDAHEIPFADDFFDAVVIQGVICWLQDPEKAVSEIYRVLKNDGLVYAETPFVQQVTGGRYDFVRYTAVGHRRLFRRFSELSAGGIGGPGMVLAWSWWFLLLSLAPSRRARSVMTAVAQVTAFWLPLLDRWIGSRPWAVDGASGVFFLGRKSDRVLSDREVIQAYTGGVR